MAVVLLIGSDGPLLEGLSQLLVSAGHAVQIARTVDDGLELAHASPPLVALVERELAAVDSRTLRLPLASGGALLLFRHTADGTPVLAPAFGRAALADLALPLERHRLVTLVGRVAERARAAGRERGGTPPERTAR
ncbi:MAG TPA: hypothetical protein VFS05_02475 [Gemmatimonadaceae bacterium]|nr:hypothetical protein [Gemmatimonadaceae bacterium]